MTKKEIYFQELPKFRGSVNAVESAMEIYTKQQIVNFIDWADENLWLMRSFDEGYRWVNLKAPVSMAKKLTTAQLYDIYNEE